MPTVLPALAAAFLLLGAAYVHGALAWVACVPLVLGCPQVGEWRRAGLMGAVLGGAVAVGGEAHWVSAAGQLYFHLPQWHAAALASALALISGGSLGALFGMLMPYTLCLPRGWSVICFPAAWVAWEGVVAGVLAYYPWLSLAATQVNHASVLQFASIVGAPGLSYVIAAVGTSMGVALRTKAHYAIIGAMIVGAVVIVGHVRLSDRPPNETAHCPLWAVDARIDPKLPREDTLLRYTTLTRRALEDGATLIVWPESALPGMLESDTTLQQQMRGLLEMGHSPATLIAGGPRVAWTGSWTRRLFNSAYEIRANGPVKTYDKQQLVPFAEYWPRIGLPRPRWLATEELSAGRTSGVFGAEGCRLGMLICFEVGQPELAADAVRRGAQALLVLSNDAQLPEEAISKQVIQAQLRAVETGVPVIRVANRGTSVVIDRYGRARESRTGGLLQLLVAPDQPAAAIYLAPFFRWACWIVTIISVGWSAHRQGR